MVVGSFSNTVTDFNLYLFWHPGIALLVYGSIVAVAVYLMFGSRGAVGRVLRPFVDTGRRAGGSTRNHRPRKFPKWLRLVAAMFAVASVLRITGVLWIMIATTSDNNKLVPIYLANETNSPVSVRYAGYNCVDGYGAYFDESIQVGDPRLKYSAAPGESIAIVSMAGENARGREDYCHRIGAVDETGAVLMLQSFTSKDLERVRWRLTIED